MSGPITWQTVNGASLADAFRPMQGAAASMNGAFDNLAGVLKERQAMDSENWQTGKINNTNAYLAKLAILGKTPTGLQDAMASGELDALQQGFGSQIDQKQTRFAAESLLDERYKQERSKVEFANMQRKENEKPIDSDGRNIIASGDTALADLWLKENSGLSNIAELQMLNSDRKRANIQAKYADNEEGRRQADQEIQKLDAADRRATNAASRAASAASIVASAEARKDNRADRKEARDERLSERTEARGDKLLGQLGRLREEESDIRGDYAGSASGLKTLSDAADKMSSPKMKILARRAVAENAKVPGMTVGAVLAGLNAMEDTDWSPTLESTYATRVKLTAAAHLKSPEAISQQVAREQRSKRVQELDLNIRNKLGLGRE